MKYAVIDIGSNSIRLMISDGNKTLAKYLSMTQLSQGLSITGVLCSEAMQRSAKAIFDFVQFAKEQSCDSCYVFATEAVRSAGNREEFVAMLKDGGVEIDILPGELEAKIGFAGVYTQGQIAVVDIGGASTEIAIGDKDGIEYTKSIKIGCVRLKDLFKENIDEIKQYCKEKVKEYGNINCTFDKLYSIGGTASTFAAIDEEMVEYDKDKIHGKSLSYNRIEELIKIIYNTPMNERDKIKGLTPKRKDVIVGSGYLLLAVMDYLKVKEVTISENDNLEGYLKYKMGII